MPSQPFSSILKNADDYLPWVDQSDDDDYVEEVSDDCDDDFCDKDGNSVYDWIESGEVGWDDSLQSYFLKAICSDGEPVWYLGMHAGELPTFDDLCNAINRAFEGSKVKFEFVATIAKT